MAGYTQDEYKKAREVNIVDFLKNQRYELENSGSSDYQLKTHDSLKISKDGHKWVWHSKGTGGESPIELIKQLEGVGTVEAIKRLSAFIGGVSSLPLTSQNVKETENKEQKSFELPEKWKDSKRAFAYLTGTRKLNPEIVNFCLAQGLIYESKKFHNVVFVGQKNNDGVAKYASLRGTYTTAEKPFKGDVTGSDKSYSFAVEGSNKELIVYESAIDALSHASLEKLEGSDWKKTHRVTLGGMSDKSIDRYLEKHSDIREITFYLDNDIDGKDKDGNPQNHGQLRAAELAEKYKTMGYRVGNLTPKGKDVNEDLKNKVPKDAVQFVSPKKEENNKETEDIMQKLELGVKSIFTSQDFLTYLKVLSKFHRYSVNNCLLIKMQMPEATKVAGYQAWKKEFERQVKKDEKGITVLAPSEYKYKDKKVESDPITGEKDEKVIERKRIFFKPVKVFDVSQTEGKEIPTLTKDLDFSVDQSKKIIAVIKNIAEANSISFNFEKINNGSKGYFSFVKNKIGIKEGMSDAQTIKTAIHELAHSRMHVPTEMAEPASNNKNTKEVQAESVAFVVSDHFGIDTSEYSFPYIASWSSGKETEELQQSLNLIKSEASKIIREIEGQLDLVKEKELAENEKTVAIKTNDTALEIFHQNVPLYFENDEVLSPIKSEKDIKDASKTIYIKSTDLEKYKTRIPHIYNGYLCNLFKEAYQANPIASLQIFGYESLIQDCLSQAIVSNDRFISKELINCDCLKECIETMEKRIEKVQSIKGKVIVQIDESEEKRLKVGQCLSFKEANNLIKKFENEKFEQKAISSRKINYNQCEKVVFGLYIEDKGQWKYGRSRYDIGDGFAYDLFDFTQRTMDRCIADVCEKELAEKEKKNPSKGKSEEEKIK